MKIGFVGVGTMGKGMALNLRKSNCDLTIVDINEVNLKVFKEKGTKTTTNIQEVLNSDIIILCLPNTEIVERTLIGKTGILKDMKQGQIVVDCSTIDYLATTKIAEEFQKKGVEFMDAPVSGYDLRSYDGTLTIMCGGSKETFDTIKPYLDFMGQDILYMGSSGSGQLTKMINNCIYNINTAAICELLPIAVKMGLDPQVIGDVIMNSTGKSGAADYFIPRILERDFEYGISMQMCYKDMYGMSNLCTQMNIPLPTFSGALQTYQKALIKGFGHLYKGAMILPYEEMLGVKAVRKE